MKKCFFPTEVNVAKLGQQNSGVDFSGRGVCARSSLWMVITYKGSKVICGESPLTAEVQRRAEAQAT